jgi:hypothetical protein
MSDMNRKNLGVLLFVITLGLLAAMDVSAAIYKYTDKDGLITFADDLQAVPVQYRSQAVIVSGEDKEAEAKSPAGQAVPKEQTEIKAGEHMPVLPSSVQTDETGGRKPFGSRVLISAIAVVSALFVFVILGILDADHKKAIKIARVVIIWVVSVYLLYSHAGDVVHVFRSLGSNVESARQESEEKGKKAAKAMKALNAVIDQAGQSASGNSTEPGPEKKE